MRNTLAMALITEDDTGEGSPDLVEDERRAKWLDSLHDVYVFFQAHPELIDSMASAAVTGYGIQHEREQAVKWVRALGQSDKDYGTYGVSVVPKPGRFGPHTVRFFATKEAICTRTVETVEREVTGPDPDAVAALPVVTHTVTDEIITWDCPPLLSEVP
jgi:hypothetical protein